MKQCVTESKGELLLDFERDEMKKIEPESEKEKDRKTKGVVVFS